jgi:hypothetical protein
VSQSSEFCLRNPLSGISTSVYFVIDSVRKLLDTPSYIEFTVGVVMVNSGLMRILCDSFFILFHNNVSF